MEKFEHISRMFNNRTVNKKYENFVVNAIYTKIGNYDLIPITQQCVRNLNGQKDSYDNGDLRHRYYLLDLYFPQLNYGVEVDEGHHEDVVNQKKDAERAEDIKSAIDCDEGHVVICLKDGKTLRPFENIMQQIDEQVVEIKKRMEGKKIVWLTDEEKRAAVFKRGYFDVKEDDDVVYESITEI